MRILKMKMSDVTTVIFVGLCAVNALLGAMYPNPFVSTGWVLTALYYTVWIKKVGYKGEKE